MLSMSRAMPSGILYSLAEIMPETPLVGEYFKNKICPRLVVDVAVDNTKERKKGGNDID
jgi:hypothetical protein